MGDILKDNRFSKYLNDPRYRQIPKSERKVKIDKRFESMFKDEKFKVKYSIDKRGRPINETSTENLRKYYELDEEEDGTSSEDEDSASGKPGDNKSAGSAKDADTSGMFVRRPQISNDEEHAPSLDFTIDKLKRGKLDDKTKEKLLDLEVDYARGEGVLQSDSSSDEDSSEGEDADGDLEHEWGELDGDAETTDESTKRIAICNMDWDNIKAADIMVLLNSFLPPGGVIHKISIYPSEYGLKRLEEEEVRGPVELTEEKLDDVDDDLEGDEGNQDGLSYHMEKLRRYQLNRLKYYYAVVECDSVTTADKLYAECDGIEYESSATKLDMRFVPDDVAFDHDPKEVCTKLPELSKYKPRLFATTALQQAKVHLTWDATNPNRTEAIKTALSGKIDDLDLNEYLASSTDDESDGGGEDEKRNQDMNSENESYTEDPIAKYKNLLKEIEDKEDKKKNTGMEMEITWGLGVKDKAEELVKKKMKEEKKNLTPFEELVKKRKEKKKQKKLERKQKFENKEGSNDDESGADVNSSDDIPSDVDMNDPYFAEEFNKPEFKNRDKKSKKNKEKVPEPDSDDEKQKAGLQLLLDDEDDGKSHFSLKKIQDNENTSKKSKRKRKLKEKLEQKQALPDFEINVNDERFSAIFNSHLYNIDPSDSNFKKTKNMEKLIHEKLKRRPIDAPDEIESKPKKSKEDAEISLLVKNIKRKTKNVK